MAVVHVPPVPLVRVVQGSPAVVLAQQPGMGSWESTRHWIVLVAVKMSHSWLVGSTLELPL